jgi:hypothetical protein
MNGRVLLVGALVGVVGGAVGCGGKTREDAERSSPGGSGGGSSEVASAGATTTAGAGNSTPLPPPGCAGVITFPDPGLEAAVRREIQRPTGDIRFEHVSQLSRLEATERGIADLAGLECLQALTDLRLFDNPVSDLSPLSGLTSLIALWMSNNSVSDLFPLSGLTSLSTLCLEESNVTDLSPLAGLTGLHLLALPDNNVTDLGPLSGLTELLWLALQDNNITDLTPLVAAPLFVDCATETLPGHFMDHCVVNLESNPFNCAQQADNIRTLEERGVEVRTDCIFTSE